MCFSTQLRHVYLRSGAACLADLHGVQRVVQLGVAHGFGVACVVGGVRHVYYHAGGGGCVLGWRMDLGLGHMYINTDLSTASMSQVRQVH